MKGLRILSLLASVMMFTALAFSAGAEVPRRAGEFVITYPGATKSQDLLSERIKGKKVTMLAFVSTTCPHCQTLAQNLSRLQAEYGKQGFQAVMVAYDPDANANLTRFKALYANGISVGVAQRDPVHNFLQISMIGPSYVPKLVVIDSKGMIREQYNGGDAYFSPEKEQANLAKSITTYLK